MNERMAASPEVRRKLLDEYLRCAPLAVALFRASEAGAIAGALPFERPILDVGCAFGEFARVFFKDDTPPELGLDIDRSELLRERAEPAYRGVVQADACRLPVPSASVGTVMSVSTLEHVPSVELAFPEIARILKPGGRLIMTVPINTFNKNLLGFRTLSVVSRSAAESYASRIHRGLTHINVWPADVWERTIADAGLTVEHSEMLLSPRATMAFETLLPAALANRLWRRVLGSRPPHPAPLRALARRAFEPLIDDASDRGSNLFLVARKSAA